MQKAELTRELDRQISVIGRHFADARRGFRDRDVTGPQFFLLRGLRDSGPETITRLAEKMGFNQTTISNVVLSLDARGYVVKDKDTHDRRITRVAITDAGTSVLEEMEADRFERLQGIFEHLSEEDLRELLRIMTNLRRSLESGSFGRGS